MSYSHTGNRIASNALTLTVAMLAALFLAACGDSGNTSPASSASSSPTGYPYRVVTTVGMVADIARHVAGDHAEVINIIGEGVDPHLYKPTRSDVAMLKSGNIVFYAGLHLEGKMGEAIESIRGDIPVHAVAEDIDPADLLSPPEFAGSHDPHVWMDASLWARSTQAIADQLAAYDPTHASDYQANAAAYIGQLTELHAYAQRVIASVPERQRILVTAHDAFNYFGRAYGIEVRGIQGISTESEAGLEDINNLVNMLVEREIAAVFVETSVSDKNIRALIEGAAAQNHTVTIGGSLFSDAMGSPGSYEGTYIGMIDHNATTIARALGGEAPAKGLNGRLGDGSTTE